MEVVALPRLSRKARSFILFLLPALLLAALPVTAMAQAGAIDTLSFSVLPATDSTKTASPAVSAASMALFDPVEGVFLAEIDADTRRPMASTTKIMTALLVLELLPLDQIVTVPSAAVGIEGSSIYLFAGEQITVRTLLYALLLASANDAAAALALHTAGSIESFAEQMNRRASELGLTDTHFVNPHGLHDPAHYTTARDLARLTAAALENPTFAEIVSTTRYSAPQNGTDATRLFLNHNRLLRSLEGAIGVKTGFTKSSGRCLVSAAKRDGLTLIAVTLNDPNDWRDHSALLDWGFSQYVALSPLTPPVSLPVVGGSAGEVSLTPRASFSRTLPATHGEVTCTVETPRFLFAGFDAGEVKGRAVYYMDGEVLGEVELVTTTAVPIEKPTERLWDRIKRIFLK